MSPLVVFLHSGEYDRMHQGLSAAAAAIASGRRVHVFFFWWALERLVQDNLDEPDFGPGRELAATRFETRNLPTLRALLEHLRASELCTLYGCTGSMAVVAQTPAGIEGTLERWVGWSAILQITEGLSDRLYL